MPTFNRGTGLLIIEVRRSNPNGDPDRESDPRMLDTDERGLISPVSLKRKVRDLVADKEGEPWRLAAETLGLPADGAGYGILETRGRVLKDIAKMNRDQFVDAYWDARLFGNTMLEAMKEAKVKAGDADHFISTGVVQVGLGLSVAPVEVIRLTQTNKAGVETGKDRGMAPLSHRVVEHAIYAMPFFVNPIMARKSGCTAKDIDLLTFLLPHAYTQTASASRPEVFVLHAWFAEHQNPLGSCPDPLILDALTPTKADPRTPSTSRAEYEIPGDLPEHLKGRLNSFRDLCVSV